MARYRNILAVIVLLLVAACGQQQKEVAKAPENTLTVKGSVRELTLWPDEPPAFPEHEGKAEFMSYCAVCHSLKYITMQPGLSAKAWDGIVTKMVAKYGAPIDSATCKKIVNYIVAVKPVQ